MKYHHMDRSLILLIHKRHFEAIPHSCQQEAYVGQRIE